MRIVRLIKYAGIATIAGGIGFAIAGGEVEVDLADAPAQIAATAREAADGLKTLNEKEAPVVDALNAVRDRIANGARRIGGYLAD
tara:strand:- start:846 stop:1100 length:255 start_codon:yes stop_codon:yes gene_type:complete